MSKTGFHIVEYSLATKKTTYEVLASADNFRAIKAKGREIIKQRSSSKFVKEDLQNLSRYAFAALSEFSLIKIIDDDDLHELKLDAQCNMCNVI